MNIDPMSEGLLRQRRNLISTSCVLVFLKFAGVQIDKLSFLGLEFGKLGNPSALYLALWIFYGYFIFRYYQYFSQEGKYKLSKCYYDDLESKVFKRIQRLAKDVNEKANYHPHQLIALQNDDYQIRVTYDGGSDGQGGRLTEVRNIVFPKKELRKYKLLTVMDISLNSSVVTDYILPFFIVLLSLIYCFQGSDSSLLQAIEKAF